MMSVTSSIVSSADIVKRLLVKSKKSNVKTLSNLEIPNRYKLRSVTKKPPILLGLNIVIIFIKLSLGSTLSLATSSISDRCMSSSDSNWDGDGVIKILKESHLAIWRDTQGIVEQIILSQSWIVLDPIYLLPG